MQSTCGSPLRLSCCCRHYSSHVGTEVLAVRCFCSPREIDKTDQVRRGVNELELRQTAVEDADETEGEDRRDLVRGDGETLGLGDGQDLNKDD